jgi:Spy/CpxP family protein refolding chaperone
MKDTWMKGLKISAVALVLSGAVVGLAGFGWGHMHCHGQKFMKRIVDAHVEEAMDKLEATADQRQKVSALEDKLLADVQTLRKAHRDAFTTLAGQFSQDQLDTATLDQTFAGQRQAMEQTRQDIRQAMVDLHDLLTPTQRQQLGSMVKERLSESDCGQ